VGVAAAMVIGVVLTGLQGWIMARFFRESNVMVRSTVSMAMAISLFAVCLLRFHDNQRFFPRLFSSLTRDVGGVAVTGPVIVVLAMSLVTSVGLWLLLNHTRLGVILRAVSARPVTAELMGVSTTGVIILVWALAGAITTAVAILVAPTRSSIPNLVILVIPGLAAAVFGAMRCFTFTIIGGLAIGVVESMSFDWGRVGNYSPAISFLVVTVALLWSQRKETWSDAR
jgi:branched-chain amino acid transport system permease protein